jgi:F-type H+-transporting ATPase subunit b
MDRAGLWRIVWAIVLALLMLAPGLAWAEEGHGDENILSPRYDLGIWTIVVFGVLLLVLRKYAWGPMLEGLQRREQNIQGALDEARRGREEAERLRADLQQEMNHAQEKVRDILDEGRRGAQRQYDELVAKARSDIQGERERLHREVDMARDQALHELWTRTAQLATLISAKAIRRQLNEDDHRRLVDEAITELRNARGDGSSAMQRV